MNHQSLNASCACALRCRFIDSYNDRCQPFTWSKDADTIRAKAKRSP
jgi:hypothetical protein